MNLFRTKSVETSLRDTEEPEHRLKKKLTALDLTVFGVGVIIGAGIFVLTGTAAATNAGPAIAVSFVIAAVACGLAALCYAEFASTVPVAGSAYTFSYATMGELVAWIIGWDLILEFVVAAAAVASGWSGYFVDFLSGTPFELPTALTSAEDGVLNLPAGLLVLVLTGILISGIKLSSRVNQIVVAIKVAVVLFVIIAGVGFIKFANYTPFVPPAEPPDAAKGGFLSLPLVQTLFGLEPAVYGWGGVVTAAAIVFFAFIGFDIVATTAEETKHPQRSLPLGILGSLAITTVLYVAVSFVITGMQNYKEIDPEDAAPLSSAFAAVGKEGYGNIVALGAIVGLVVVVMILMLGQTRVGFAMARDGLLPRGLAKVHPRFGTPHIITLIVGVLVAVITAFLPISELAELVNIGTLFAFVLVSIGVIVLRRTRPDLPRAFRVPLVPLLPILAALISLYLMLNLSGLTWVRFGGWMAIGFLVYFLYGYHNSRVGRGIRAKTDV
ncbi:MAG: amino acid permease [Micromonosporaceae bacterium]